MPDSFTPEKRSNIMSRVKGKDTAPEKTVRRLLHRMGYRFRLRRTDLPGKPDIVLPKFRAAIFVHGCFWHGHLGCRRAARPTSNVEFWNKKIDRNIERDARVQHELTELRWNVLVVWQCQLRDVNALETRLTDFLQGNTAQENANPILQRNNSPETSNKGQPDDTLGRENVA